MRLFPIKTKVGICIYYNITYFTRRLTLGLAHCPKYRNLPIMKSLPNISIPGGLSSTFLFLSIFFPQHTRPPTMRSPLFPIVLKISRKGNEMGAIANIMHTIVIHS